jgi:DNA mismatch endonuclease (patch repair protein)
MVFPKYKKVIFINGCFWHGHKGCKRAALPATNTEFWRKKISSNVKRDKSNYKELKKIGWKPLIIWQCKIKKSTEEMLRKRISDFLES